MDNHKVAVFIDFDNIRIGVRQHFGAEISPRKLMEKAARYGSVLEAKAYADFTEYARDFRDRLLFAAGIQPVHAPVKTSGGRRQSSADLHMVMDLFTLALDRPDIDTVVLMTGDGDFMRMVALLRHRFGKRVVVAGVEGASTNTELMQSADIVDPIKPVDTDPMGQLSGPARPREASPAPLQAVPAPMAASEPAKRRFGSLLGGFLGRRDEAPPATAAPAPTAQPGQAEPRSGRSRRRRRGPGEGTEPQVAQEPVAPARTRRLRATAEPRPPAARAAAKATAQRRTAEQPRRALTPELVDRLVQVIDQIPPGRGGYLTWKVIEESLRARAAESGWTRKEAAGLLEQLREEGLVARMTRMRGQSEQQIGELVREHPAVQRALQAGDTPVGAAP